MRFKESFLEDLEARNDIVSIVSQYVTLRPSGRLYSGLCPFHNEKSPSFFVYPETSSYYCFGCGSGGSVINFVQNIENLDFTDAVRFLCDRCGMAMPTDNGAPDDTSLRRRAFEANRDAAKFFFSMLSDGCGAQARAYIQKRALTDETVRHFGLGFAPDSWDALTRHMKSLGYTEAELIAFDLAKRSSRGSAIDAFRNRLMFPIIDLRGNVIAFGGRVFDDSKPKYLNSSDTLVFKKSRELFALNFAKNVKSRRLILCEGYMDVIALHQAGFTEAVAGLGTSFTQEQASLIARYADEVLLSFDSDGPGQKATARALKILSSSNLKVRVLDIVGGKDPDEIIRTEGREKMQRIIDGSLNDTEYALSGIRRSYDLTTDDGKVGFFGAAVPVLAAVKNGVERDIYISRLSNELGVSREAVASQVEYERKRAKRNDDAQLVRDAGKLLRGGGPSKNPDIKAHPSAVNAEQVILADILADPELLRKLGTHISPDSFITDFDRRLFEVISGRIRDGGSLDIAALSAELSQDEISEVSMLTARGAQLARSVGECLQCLKKLSEEKELPPGKNVADMPMDEFRELVARLGEKKKHSSDGNI